MDVYYLKYVYILLNLFLFNREPELHFWPILRSQFLCPIGWFESLQLLPVLLMTVAGLHWIISVIWDEE